MSKAARLQHVTTHRSAANRRNQKQHKKVALHVVETAKLRYRFYSSTELLLLSHRISHHVPCSLLRTFNSAVSYSLHDVLGHLAGTDSALGP
jgi:hypothetical protein